MRPFFFSVMCLSTINFLNTVFAESHKFWLLYFLLLFCLWPVDYLEVRYLVFGYLKFFSRDFSVNDFQFTSFVLRKCTLCKLNLLKCTETSFMVQDMTCPSKRNMYIEKNIHAAIVGSLRSKYLTVHIFSIFTNFISHQECMLKSPIVIETLSISPFGSVSFAFHGFWNSVIRYLCNRFVMFSS